METLQENEQIEDKEDRQILRGVAIVEDALKCLKEYWKIPIGASRITAIATNTIHCCYSYHASWQSFRRNQL